MTEIVSLVLFILTLAIAAAISRIATDVRKIRKHFDRIDNANEPAPTPAAVEAPAPARRAFVPPPIRTPDPTR